MVGNKMDYKAMLLALCKDDNSTKGLTKALSILMNKNIDTCNVSLCTGYNIKFLMDTLLNTLILCLRNYIVNTKMFTHLNCSNFQCYH